MESPGGGTLDVLTAAIAASPEPCAIGLAGDVVFANPAFCALFGHDEDRAIVGHPVVALAAPTARDQLAHNIALRGRGEAAPRSYRSIGLRKDGTTFDVELNVITMKLEGRDYSLAVLRDVSEQRGVEDKLRDRE